jgi:hypothetical protein
MEVASKVRKAEQSQLAYALKPSEGYPPGDGGEDDKWWGLLLGLWLCAC